MPGVGSIPFGDNELEVERLGVLRERKDFLAAARAKRCHTTGFLLQIRNRHDGDPPRVGFTCSKKIGNAVKRNKAKRRLREIARVGLAPKARQGHDYVFVGRPNVTIARQFSEMLADLNGVLSKQ